MRDALALLTTIGRRGGALSSRALAWFPVVGALVGAAIGGAWWLTDRWWPPAVAGALTVVVEIALTGMLHLDGLADAADGLLPHATRERRLEIMRDVRVGAFGTIAVALALLLEVSALAARPPSIVLLVVLTATTRAVAACVPGRVRYARPEGGMVSPLTGGGPVWLLGVPVVAAVAGALLVGRAALAAVIAATAVMVALVLWARRRVGGFTGDVLGAAIVVGQVFGLVVAAAKW
jgi:adenosylcobinamide-GDP ribazoletransferase